MFQFPDLPLIVFLINFQHFFGLGPRLFDLLEHAIFLELQFLDTCLHHDCLLPSLVLRVFLVQHRTLSSMLIFALEKGDIWRLCIRRLRLRWRLYIADRSSSIRLSVRGRIGRGPVEGVLKKDTLGTCMLELAQILGRFETVNLIFCHFYWLFSWLVLMAVRWSIWW